MTFSDWVHDSAEDVRQFGFVSGISMAGRELARGGVRRLESVYPLGESIWSKDWDVLLVLDACRTDHMYEVAPDSWLPERNASRQTRWSEASCSRTWISRAIAGATPDDKQTLAYLTGNPFSGQSHPHTDGIPLCAEEYAELWEGWRYHWGAGPHNVPTMPPDPITDHVIDTWRNRAEKGVDRLIAHYMQPHYPFINRPGTGPDGHTQLETWGNPDSTGIFDQLRLGEIGQEEIDTAFRENTAWILDQIEPIAENVDAKIAISADHGNGFGKLGAFGHVEGELAPAVRRVPWVEFDAVDKRTYHPDIADEEVDVNVSDQLEALGYT